MQSNCFATTSRGSKNPSPAYPAWSFGKDKGGTDYANDSSPGPIYDAPKLGIVSNQRKPSSVSFGAGKRKGFSDVGQSPGPAAYGLPSVGDRRGAGFGASKRKPLSNAQNTPGPGAYGMVSMTRFGSDSRDKRSVVFTTFTGADDRVQKGPDPGTYFREKLELFDKTPLSQAQGEFAGGVSFGVSCRPELTSRVSTPGPGAYGLGQSAMERTGGKFSTSVRPDLGRKDVTKGLGIQLSAFGPRNK